jgi:hypothetical protein
VVGHDDPGHSRPGVAPQPGAYGVAIPVPVPGAVGRAGDTTGTTVDAESPDRLHLVTMGLLDTD